MKRSPLKRASQPLRRSRLSPISNRRRVELGHYTRLRKSFLADRPTCECCDRRPSTDVHHKLGRTSGNYLRVSTWLAVCRECHTYIHKFPKLARAFGLLGGVANPSQP